MPALTEAKGQCDRRHFVDKRTAPTILPLWGICGQASVDAIVLPRPKICPELRRSIERLSTSAWRRQKGDYLARTDYLS